MRCNPPGTYQRMEPTEIMTRVRERLLHPSLEECFDSERQYQVARYFSQAVMRTQEELIMEASGNWKKYCSGVDRLTLVESQQAILDGLEMAASRIAEVRGDPACEPLIRRARGIFQLCADFTVDYLKRASNAVLEGREDEPLQNIANLLARKRAITHVTRTMYDGSYQRAMQDVDKMHAATVQGINAMYDLLDHMRTTSPKRFRNGHPSRKHVLQTIDRLHEKQIERYKKVFCVGY